MGVVLKNLSSTLTDFKQALMNGEVLKKPSISVVMPIYNQSGLVSNAINSIITQTIDDFELIIVDDGSDDLPVLRDVIRRFNDGRIKLAEKKHEGLVVARNYGNELATSDVIAIQDADDLSMPDRLEKCLIKIKEGSDVVYHGAYYNVWDGVYNCIRRHYIPADKLDKKRLLKEQYITGWPVFRKKIWQEKPFRIETQHCYDWMMWLDWAFSDFKISGIDEGLYEYVRHENSASVRFEKEGKRDESIKKIKEIMINEYKV